LRNTVLAEKTIIENALVVRFCAMGTGGGGERVRKRVSMEWPGRYLKALAGGMLLLIVLVVPVRACSPYIEESPDHLSATFRVHTTVFEHCPVSEETYQRLVTQWVHSRSSDLPVLQSLYLGRAADFPWLSRQIADVALKVPGWKSLVAATPRGRLDSLAAQVLQGLEMRRRLAIPFAGTGYQVAGISYEKVLYGKASEYASHGGNTMVPFDAQLWLRLAPGR
jgi:hypothetical protein